VKRAFAVITLVLGVVCTYGNAISVQGQPSEWSLSVNSGGAPWTKQFNVELNHRGLLEVTEKVPAKMPKTPNDPVTKLSLQLSATEVKEIYNQALRALFSRAAKRPYEIADGTVITVKLVAPGRASMRGFHVGVTEEEAPQVAKLLP
jgi:hypothetical protein